MRRISAGKGRGEWAVATIVEKLGLCAFDWKGKVEFADGGLCCARSFFPASFALASYRSCLCAIASSFAAPFLTGDIGWCNLFWFSFGSFDHHFPEAGL